MCGSPSELLVVFGIVVVFYVANVAARARARSRSLHQQEDDGIRVRFLSDDDSTGNDDRP